MRFNAFRKNAKKRILIASYSVFLGSNKAVKKVKRKDILSMLIMDNG
jgi:hypothetical protein